MNPDPSLLPGASSPDAPPPMLAETHLSAVGGELSRVVLRPAGGVAPRFGVALFHGLGDHMGGYGEVVAAMVEAGGMVIGTDWPGNGASPGSRGHIGSVAMAVALIAETVGELEATLPPAAPLVLAAHSTGAFLAVQYLVGHRAPVSHAWLNGALVEPAAGQPWLKQVAARGLGRVLPRVTVPLGVPPDRLRVPDLLPGRHARVSLGFGAALMRAREGLFSRLGEISPDLDLLMTHGAEDAVCLPVHARRLFEAVPARRKEFVLLPGLCHETFRDVGRAALFAVLCPWLERVARGRRPSTGGGASGSSGSG